MVASVRGGGVEIEISEEDSTSDENTGGANDGKESMIASLLLQGASLTAQTDRSGESLMFESKLPDVVEYWPIKKQTNRSPARMKCNLA